MLNDIEKIWAELWDDVQKRQHDLESEIQRGVSEERRLQLEVAFRAAHQLWWDTQSPASATNVNPPLTVRFKYPES